jgi:hypothetical protein
MQTSSEHDPGSRLRHVLIRREGYPNEFMFVPTCCVCDKVIVDLETASVSVPSRGNELALTSLGEYGDTEVLDTGQTGFAVCQECDVPCGAHWLRAACVFNADQRREWEKVQDEQRRPKRRRSKHRA